MSRRKGATKRKTTPPAQAARGEQAQLAHPPNTDSHANAHADHLPARWVAPILAIAALVVGSLIAYRMPRAKVQIVAHSDSVAFRLASPAHLANFRVRGLTVTGVSKIHTPNEKNPEGIPVDPSVQLTIVASPPSPAAPGVTGDRLALDLTAPAESMLSFERVREGSEGRYRVAVSRAPTALDITLQRRQSIVTEQPIEGLPQAGDEELPVTFVAGASPGLVFQAQLEGEARLVPPFEVQRIDFLQASPLQSGEIAGLYSRLVGAELTWIDVPGKTSKLPQGTTLLLRDPRGRLAGLSLGTTDLAMTFSGTIESATVGVAGSETSPVPSIWDWLLASSWGHLIVALASLCTTAFAVVRWMRARRQTGARFGAAPT